MRALVVYESMYGNTHLVAQAIGAGLVDGLADGLADSSVEGSGSADQVMVIPVHQAGSGAYAGALADVDLVVVGGPTHGHGMSHESTRTAALEAAQDPESELTIDPDAEGPGVREWLAEIDGTGRKAAAFDTRVDMAAVLTGRASKGISRKLRHCGFAEAAEPESFLVTKDSHLEPGEAERARAWGRQLAGHLTRPTGTSAGR